MRTRHLIIAAALFAACGVAFADSPEYTSQDTTAAAPKTRAQVRDELVQAESQGLTNQSDERYPLIPQVQQRKTRAQVIAELREAQSQGLSNSRDDLYPIIPGPASHRSRSEVKAEAIQAARAERNGRAVQGLYFGG